MESAFYDIFSVVAIIQHSISEASAPEGENTGAAVSLWTKTGMCDTVG